MCSEQVLKSRRPDKLNELKFKYFRRKSTILEPIVFLGHNVDVSKVKIQLHKRYGGTILKEKLKKMSKKEITS